jgi:hypothetical protein
LIRDRQGQELLTYDIGPYEIEQDLILECEVTGGKPKHSHPGLTFVSKARVSVAMFMQGILKGGSITVLLTSCLTDF